MAKVTKILETTLAAGATAAIFNDADIPNSLIRVFATNSNIYPQSVSLSGTTLTVTYEAQTASMGVAIELTKQGLDIIDNLTSSDDAAALSAKQGKALKDAIDAIPEPPENITDLSDVLITDIEDGQVLAWDDSEQKFVNVDQSGGSGIVYSLSERQVGLWVDDKPLYQLTIHYTGTADSTDFQVTIATLNNNVEMKSIIDGGLWRDGILFSPTVYAPTDVYYRYVYNPSDYTLGLRVGSSLNDTLETYVTIQYTKSTD